jgi:hypothetical protein
VLAIYIFQLNNSSVSETDFNPRDVDEVIHLLPDKCKLCMFAVLQVILASHVETRIADPIAKIQDIDEQCIGYQEGYDNDETGLPDERACPYRGVLRARYEN